MLLKLPYGTMVICVLFTRQSRQVILEANEVKKWEIRDVFNVVYGNYAYPLELLFMESRLV